MHMYMVIDLTKCIPQNRTNLRSIHTQHLLGLCPHIASVQAWQSVDIKAARVFLFFHPGVFLQWMLKFSAGVCMRRPQLVLEGSQT